MMHEEPMGQLRTLYEILDVAPDASNTDVEAGFKRAMETFSEDALASYALFTPDEADRARKEIQLAFAVLSQPSSRSAYDAALATATDKAAATHSFTMSWEEPHQGTTSISDGRVTQREEPAAVDEKRTPDETQYKRTNTGRIVVASPVEDTPARASEAPPDVHAAETLPPMPAAGAPVVEHPPAQVIPSSIPVSLTPTEPPTPAPASVDSTPPAQKFKRVRLDDDSVSVTVSSPAAPPAVASAPPANIDVLGLQDNAEVNGAVLQRLRESRNISIKTMSEVTKVSVHYLKAIEGNAFSELPTRVYLRGFLIQYARALKVSPDKLANGYLAFADRFKNQLR